jgi:CO dehydrogenase maturation factor
VKLAIAGKGGSGKTSIAGTAARLLARRGRSVLAIDGDSNPNLALTLGLPPEALNGMPTLTREMLERTETGTQLAQPLDEICRTHSVPAPDGVTLLVMANPQHAGTG